MCGVGMFNLYTSSVIRCCCRRVAIGNSHDIHIPYLSNSQCFTIR
jgi:hypothetical protein